MKKAIYIIIFLIVIILIFLLTTKNTAAPVVVDRSGGAIDSSIEAEQEEVVVEYMCDQGAINLALSGDDFTNAQLSFASGEEAQNLTRVVSASGTYYATADESFVFWSEDGTAFITQNNETIYDNCNEQ